MAGWPFRLVFSLALAASAAACGSRAGVSTVAPAEPSIGTAEFAALIDRLSEPGGFFASDNLVSNETSYLHVLGAMRSLGVNGGAYLGVGPDQNFSYIAAIRPEIAFLIDIRRDNMLQHLMFKAVFELSRNRLEYLALMTGKPVPKDLARWDNADIETIITHLDSAQVDAKLMQSNMRRVREAVLNYGYPLNEGDLATIERIHVAFFEWGLETRYSNRGRLGGYPTWRQLILETDLDGKRSNYLATEANYQFIRSLQRRNLIVPVTGDLSGPHALAAVGQEIKVRGLRISAFYTSNVEQYLMQGPAFANFAQTVTQLPFDSRSVLIRSYFRGRHPLNVPGHTSTQLLERFETFVKQTVEGGGYRTHYELVTKNVLPLRN